MCRKRNVYTMSELNLALMALFNGFNKEYFGGDLEKVIITTKEGAKSHAYGWITTNKCWKQGEAERYELNISCDYLHRSVEAIAATLLHEMCHLYAMQYGIQDTSRSGFYHNERFKQIAEDHHLSVTHSDKVGWNDSKLDGVAAEWVQKNCGIADIRVKMQPPPPKAERKKKPSSTRKYICPNCETSVRATKEVRIICGDCDELMKLS